MQEILELIKSDNFLLGMVIFIIMLFLITLYTCIKYSKLEKNYKKFIKKFKYSIDLLFHYFFMQFYIKNCIFKYSRCRV